MSDIRRDKNAEERFTIDHGIGNGYTVYYRRKNGCYCYTVTYDDNGCLIYSHTNRVPLESFNYEKEKANDKT